MTLTFSSRTLQYGKVKRDIRGNEGDDGEVGGKRNLGALCCGVVAPPFLGLLACYDTRRALNTHRACVVIFFAGTMAYMLLVLSIYSHLAASAGLAAAELQAVRLSFRAKRGIAAIFFTLTAFYLPIGVYLCEDIHGTDYLEADLLVHTARAVCQHLAVVAIILFYGTASAALGHWHASRLAGWPLGVLFPPTTSLLQAMPAAGWSRSACCAVCGCLPRFTSVCHVFSPQFYFDFGDLKLFMVHR